MPEGEPNLFAERCLRRACHLVTFNAALWNIRAHVPVVSQQRAPGRRRQVHYRSPSSIELCRAVFSGSAAARASAPSARRPLRRSEPCNGG